MGDLLRAEGFSLQGNAKALEGNQHPDRDAQFRYISEQARAHQDSGDPVISVDTKKKELVGEFRNAGRQWRPKGQPAAVRTHDFPGDSAGKAIPYGVYDMTADAGWVNVGTDHDTAAFAVESIRRWWNAAGSSEYPAARWLLITADAGGSNGYRTRAWKAGLAALGAETGLQITVCHFPPGTSKWNKVEHRLFSHITMNWRGRPLISRDVVINSIAATTTRAGLTVQARLDDGTYPTGVKVTSAQMAALPVSRHPFHGDWNYTLHPAAMPPASKDQEPSPAVLPELTGMTTAELDELITQLTALRQAQREEKARSHPAGDARHKPRRSATRLRLPRPRRGHRAPPAPGPARRHRRPPARRQPHHRQASPHRNPGPAGPARAPHRAGHRPARPAHADPAICLSHGRQHRERDQQSVLIICKLLVR